MLKLSRDADITEGHLGNIENGRNDCSTSIAKRIAAALGVTLDELLIETQDSKTDNAGTPSQASEASGKDSGQVEDGEHTAATESE